jgi:hypothetical protein
MPENTMNTDLLIDLEVVNIDGNKEVPVDTIRVSLDHLVRSFLLNETRLSTEEVDRLSLLDIDLLGG